MKVTLNISPEDMALLESEAAVNGYGTVKAYLEHRLKSWAAYHWIGRIANKGKPVKKV